MKNHYISQFIIKRFSNAINVFDINDGKIDLNKRPSKVFYKDDIYTEELEKLMNINIESRVANIIDQKILDKEEIRLTRKELYLLKRYMLIASVRNYTPKQFVDFLKGFTSNADRYLLINKLSYAKYNINRSIHDLKLSDEEIYLNALKVYAIANTPLDIAASELATKEMLAWAIPFLEGYIAFWDAPEDKEFILSDCTMGSEYEGFHLITGGIDISKTSYLLDRCMKKEPIELILGTQSVMYENYDFFNLSSTRTMVLINPFFRLYHNHIIKIENEIFIPKKPDIWPAIIQDRNLFDVPKNEYKLKGFYHPDDLFIYSPKVLNNEDYIYINNLMLMYSKEVIGFNNPHEIIDTIYYHIWAESQYGSIQKENNDFLTVLQRISDSLLNSPYNILIDYCMKVGKKPDEKVLLTFEKILNNIYMDFNENRYICEYYLKNQKGLKEFTQLDFLGKGDLKIEFFKQHLEEILKRNKC